MFQFVHSVEYVIRNLDDTVAYMEKTFRMKPVKFAKDKRGTVEADYVVGTTQIRFMQPAPGGAAAEFLEKNGPGVYRVAWGTDDIPEAARQLKASGATIKYEQGFQLHPGGYRSTLISGEDSPVGLRFELAELAKQ